MADAEFGWAAALHDLWSSIATVTSRAELAKLVLPPLLDLPGVVLAWGLRYGPDGAVTAYQSAGHPLDGEARRIAVSLAAAGRASVPVADLPDPERAWLHAQGGCRVLTTPLDVPGDMPGTFVLLLDRCADPEFVATCLRQVAEATGEAVHRVTGRRVAEEQQVRDALLAEASLQMDAVLDPVQTMQRVARMAVPAVAEGCLVYVNDHGRPVLRSSVHVDMRRLAALLGDERVAAELLEVATATMAGRPAGARSRPLDAQVLRARGRVVGVLLLLYERAPALVPPPYFLQDLAHRAALAIDNSELYEQRRREVVAMQQHLLPTRLPRVDGLAIAASYRVGDQVMEVGGDFYDVVTRPDGAVAALIGDVCGRGVDAAALTGMARHRLGALLQEGISPARAFGRLNSALRWDGSWRFITAGLAVLRPVADGVGVQWMSCGHPAPVIMRRGGPAAAGRGGGVPLGILPRASIGRSRLTLAPGDTLLMFTDGLTESRDADGRMFEEAGLWAALDRLRAAPLEVLVRELADAAAAFGTTAADDIAVLAIRANGPDDD